MENQDSSMLLFRLQRVSQCSLTNAVRDGCYILFWIVLQLPFLVNI